MKIPVYEVIVGESLPDLKLWVSTAGDLITGLGTGHSFSLTVRDADDSTDLFVKTTGFTGQTGTGGVSGGTPNLVIEWATSDELDRLSGGRSHKAMLTITRASDTRVRYYEFTIRAVAQV